MLICVDSIKEILGLPLTPPDAEVDALIERSGTQAQVLVSAYVGYSVEQDLGQQKTLDFFQLGGRKMIRLSEYPVRVTSVKIDDVEVPADQYSVEQQLGMVKFKDQQPYIEHLAIKYTPGFTADNVPADMLSALENITIAIYENGGRIPTPAAAGELKSMTMFDAMSMSFETGGENAGAVGTPQGLVQQWAFVLDRYCTDKYVMGV